MSCKIPLAVLEYLEEIESGKYKVCKEQIALCEYVRKVFANEDIYVEEERLEKYLNLAKYTKFRILFPWEKFLTALWLCTYRKDGRPRWKQVFCMLGRGAGKDGFIAYTSMCLISPYNPVKYYDVDICAINEEQAMRPVTDFVEGLEDAENEKKLKKHYYHTKEKVKGYKNLGIMRGRTNNPKGKDGMRSGCVIFNEVHTYENYANITVFKTGQGKTAEPRVGFFTSNGDVTDGPLDDYLEKSREILFDDADDKGFLPFVCHLDGKEEVDDSSNWTKANPSLPYLSALYDEIEEEYEDWKRNPAENRSFMTKRMGLRDTGGDISVTEYENIKATNRELPDLTGCDCVVGLDYAEISDFASVSFLFKKDGNIYNIHHSWLCLQSRNLHRIKAPWKEWANDGLITVVDDVSINPDLLAEYIADMGTVYNIKKFALDHFRWTLVSSAFKKIGVDANDRSMVKLIRPSDIMQIVPMIQEQFDRQSIICGNDPVFRWAVNNTKRVRASKKIGCDTGNFIYAKIEAKSRKTDPFMSFVAAECISTELEDIGTAEIPDVGAFTF